MYLTVKEQELLEKLPSGSFSLGELHLRIGKAYLNQLLSRLAGKKKVTRLKKGLYFQGTGVNSREKMALALSSRGYLAFATALKHYGLLDEELSRVFVATRKQRAFVDLGSFDVKLVPLGDQDFYGIVEENGLKWSTLAKTFFDCFKKPWLAGGVGKVLAALDAARLQKQDWIEWLYYLENTKSKSLKQKTGFLLEKKAPGWFLRKLGKSIGTKNVVLLGDSKGKVLNKNWMVYHQ